MSKKTKQTVELASQCLQSLPLPTNGLVLRRLRGRNGKKFSGIMSYRELLSITKPNDAHTVQDSFIRKQRPTNLDRAANLSRKLFKDYQQGNANSLSKVMLTIPSNLVSVRDMGNNAVELVLRDKADPEDGGHRTLGPAVLLNENIPGYEQFLENYDVDVEISLCDTMRDAQQGFLDANNGLPVRKGSKAPIEDAINNRISYRITRSNKYDWNVILGTTKQGHLFTPAIFADGAKSFEDVLIDQYDSNTIDNGFMMLLDKLVLFRDHDFPNGINNHRQSHVLFVNAFWRNICKVSALLYGAVDGDVSRFADELDKILANFENTTLWMSADNTWTGVLYYSNRHLITGTHHFALPEEYLTYKFGLPFHKARKNVLKQLIRSYGNRTGDVLGEPWR